MNWRQVSLGLAAGLVVGASGTAWAQENPGVVDGIASVAGLAPFERPERAPVLSDFQQTGEWRAKALRGISEPLPPSLKFIDSQGAWYTPFDQPGMLGPYDLRGWHGKAAP